MTIQQTPGWPVLPETLVTAIPGGKLRLVDDPLAERIDAAVTENVAAEIRRFMTRPPFPMCDFIQDATRATYALVDESEQPLGFTSVYNPDREAGHVTLGFTVVLPEARGRGVNAAMKHALFQALEPAGVNTVWFRMDHNNEASRLGVQRSGAVFSHEEDAPREYPDGRVSRSHFYRRRLLPADWVFAASNEFAHRTSDVGELAQLVEAGLGSSLDWLQIQNARQKGVYVAFDAEDGGWRVSADESTLPALERTTAEQALQRVV